MDYYKNNLIIDKFNLDEELIKQPVLFDQYTSQLNELYALRDTHKFDLERIYARLDVGLRNIANEEGKKLTEAALENQILNNKEYQIIQAKLNETNAKIKELEVIKEALLQKRDSLKMLVELYIAGYWSTIEPKILRDERLESIKNKIIEKRTNKQKEEN